jgi:hypothetical protein
MPGQARKDVIREGEIGTYHVFTHNCGGEYLLGKDTKTGIDNSFMRERAEQLIGYLARLFAIDVAGHNVLSNHIHLILRSRPDRAWLLSDVEVAWRWKCAWPRYDEKHRRWRRVPTDAEVEELLNDSQRLSRARAGLSSISWFMARLKQPLSEEINRALNRKGTCWASRFGAKELIDDAAVLVCMEYLAVNQIKAGMADTLEQSHYSSIQSQLITHRLAQADDAEAELRRLESQGIRLEEVDLRRLYLNCAWLAPVSASGPLKLINDAWQAMADPGNPPQELPTLVTLGQHTVGPSPLVLPRHCQVATSHMTFSAEDDTTAATNVRTDEGGGDVQASTTEVETSHARADLGSVGENKSPDSHADDTASTSRESDCAPNLGQAASPAIHTADADCDANTPREIGPDSQTAAALDEWLPRFTPFLATSPVPDTSELLPTPPTRDQSGPPVPHPSPNEAFLPMVDKSREFGNPTPHGESRTATTTTTDTTSVDSMPNVGQVTGRRAEPKAKARPRIRRTSQPRPRQQRRPATYDIHNALIDHLPMRASENPILGMPLDQFLEITELAAERVLDERQRKQGRLIPPKPLPISAIMVLCAWGINPGTWLKTLDLFEKLFRRVVGIPKNVEEYTRKMGRKRVAGMKACREAFCDLPSSDVPYPDTPQDDHSPPPDTRNREASVRDGPSMKVADTPTISISAGFD